MGYDLASNIKTVAALQPQLLSGEGAAVYGPAIDRKGYEAAVIAVQSGTPSGSPANVGIVVKMQTKSGETDWVDVADMTTTISGEGQIPHIDEIDYDLKSSSRYIRAVATPHFTEGSSPKIELAATCVLGEPRVKPA
jgi:hypothetical protein